MGAQMKIKLSQRSTSCAGRIDKVEEEEREIRISHNLFNFTVREQGILRSSFDAASSSTSTAAAASPHSFVVVFLFLFFSPLSSSSSSSSSFASLLALVTSLEDRDSRFICMSSASLDPEGDKGNQSFNRLLFLMRR